MRYCVMCSDTGTSSANGGWCPVCKPNGGSGSGSGDAGES